MAGSADVSRAISEDVSNTLRGRARVWLQYAARTKRVKLRPPSGQNPPTPPGHGPSRPASGRFHFRSGVPDSPSHSGLFQARDRQHLPCVYSIRFCTSPVPALLIEAIHLAAVPDTFTTLCRNWQAMSLRVGNKASRFVARPSRGFYRTPRRRWPIWGLFSFGILTSPGASL